MILARVGYVVRVDGRRVIRSQRGVLIVKTVSSEFDVRGNLLPFFAPLAVGRIVLPGRRLGPSHDREQQDREGATKERQEDDADDGAGGQTLICFGIAADLHRSWRRTRRARGFQCLAEIEIASEPTAINHVEHGTFEYIRLSLRIGLVDRVQYDGVGEVEARLGIIAAPLWAICERRGRSQGMWGGKRPMRNQNEMKQDQGKVARQGRMSRPFIRPAAGESNTLTDISHVVHGRENAFIYHEHPPHPRRCPPSPPPGPLPGDQLVAQRE